MTPARATLKQLMATEYAVNQHPERLVDGWQVYQSVKVARDFAERGSVPAWHFWAAFWDLAEPVIVAETLADLETQVAARQDRMIRDDPVLLARHNRRQFAARAGWPDGVARQCEDLEQDYPRWRVTWSRERGYVGSLDTPMHRCEYADEDPHELAALMADVPEHDYSVKGCAWCLAQGDRRARLYPPLYVPRMIG